MKRSRNITEGNEKHEIAINAEEREEEENNIKLSDLPFIYRLPENMKREKHGKICIFS